MKLTKITLLITAILFAAQSASQAFVIQLSAASVVPGGGIRESASGAPLNNTDYIATYGYFTQDGTAGGVEITTVVDLLNVATITTWQNFFVSVGSNTTFNDQASVQGTFNDLVNIADSTDPGGLPFTFADYQSQVAGRQVWGAFTGNGLVGLFLDEATFVSGIDDLNALTGSSFLSAQVTPAFGGNTGDPLFTGSGATLFLEAVPEPSRALLTLFGAMGVVLVRRRRNS